MTTEWRMVPVEPTREMVAAGLGRTFHRAIKLAVLAAPSPWRPMAEAPREHGRLLLLGFDDASPAVGSWFQWPEMSDGWFDVNCRRVQPARFIDLASLPEPPR